MKRKLIIIGSVIVILILSFVIMGSLSKMKPEVKKEEKPLIKKFVKASQIKYGEIQTEFKETGRVSSQNSIDLSTEVRGKILLGAIPFKKGQSFKQGQLLLKIYNEEAQLALQAHKSRFLNSLANILPDIKIDFNENYNTWIEFFESVDIQKSLPQIPEPKSNKEKIFLASRNILADYYTIKSEEITLSKYYIFAPFNGSYTNVYIETGAVANPGVRIASIIRTDKLELEIPVETENIKHLSVGQNLKILPSNEEKEFSGRITRISNFVDPQTQSISVFIDLAKGPNKIYQGEYMKAIFSDIKIKNAVEIPRNAVFNQNQVFVVKEGKLKKQTVNVLMLNEETAIINGPEEGANIVTEALINAVDNMEVEILK